MRRSAILAPVLTCLGLLFAVTADAGTILSAGEYQPSETGFFDRPALFATDTQTGASTILSDLRDPAQGPLGTRAADVAVTPRGRIVLLDHDGSVPGTRGTLFAVDARGRRTVLSDLGDPAKGPLAVTPEEIAVSRSGTIYLVDGDAGLLDGGSVVTVDPRDGTRRLVSAFGDPSQGPALSLDPYAIAVHRDGTILVLDYAALYAIDPRDGRRTIVSVFEDESQGVRLIRPEALVTTARGEILIGDPEIETRRVLGEGDRAGAVVRVDRVTGLRSVVSRSGDAADGPPSYGPWALTTTPGGALYAWSARPAEFGGLFAIDVASGLRRFLGTIASPRDGWRGDGRGIAYHSAQLVRCQRGGCKPPLPQRD